jgi:hypothetical protein
MDNIPAAPWMYNNPHLRQRGATDKEATHWETRKVKIKLKGGMGSRPSRPV